MANTHLEEMQRRATWNRSLAESLVANMSLEQLGWSPAPGSWSPVEVLQHLNRTSEKYHDLVRGAIDRSRTRNLHDNGEFRPGWFQRWVINQFEPRQKLRRLPAPAAFRPVTGHPVDSGVRDRFFEHCDSLQQLLDDAEGVPLSAIRFASPVTFLLRFNLGEAFWVLVAHDHRHLLQIQRICSAPGYPGH